MDKKELLDYFFTEKLAAVIRTADLEDAKAQVEVLVGSGLKIIEISKLNSSAPEIIKWAHNSFPLIKFGMASILSLKDAREACECGADFLVSPVANKLTLEFMKEQKQLFIPGVLTPSEIASILEEHKEDFKLLKLFPADSLTSFQSIKKVFHTTKFALSGFKVKELKGFLEIGADFFAIGAYFTENLSYTENRVKEVKSLLRLY
jgi:2-dehydro-3-deoxyphosphogluconate aldolase/(4S)-4-hydroxy-2-oxoglutarate aldolase